VWPTYWNMKLSLLVGLFLISAVGTIPPMFHIHSTVYHPCHIVLSTDSHVQQNTANIPSKCVSVWWHRQTAVQRNAFSGAILILIVTLNGTSPRRVACILRRNYKYTSTAQTPVMEQYGTDGSLRAECSDTRLSLIRYITAEISCSHRGVHEYSSFLGYSRVQFAK
jgi:hypothetical protein